LPITDTQRKFITENNTGRENQRQKNKGKAEDENAWGDYDTRTHQAQLQWIEIEYTRQSKTASSLEPADGRELEEEDPAK